MSIVYPYVHVSLTSDHNPSQFNTVCSFKIYNPTSVLILPSDWHLCIKHCNYIGSIPA